MRFSDLPLIEPLQRALAEEGYTEPTPIQQQALPPALEGRDLLGIAQTGTGKTAAFALPVLQRLAAAPVPSGRRPVRALVLTPTRELAAQVGESFRAYGRHLPLRSTVVFGGVGMRPQVEALWKGVDVLVATPGRLLDLLGQRRAELHGVSLLVLDEADRMLDMGFLPDVRRILAHLPKQRQTLFFSATMDREPQALADQILKDPVRVAVTPQATTVEKVEQRVYFVEKPAKQDLLERLLGDPALARTLVFTRTKHGADKVVRRLHGAGVHAAALHANKSQGQRERALEAFRRGTTRVLVATDIAARGIDVDGITHVINFDLPNVPESYVHRIGRTARAGATGHAISFCDSSERAYLRDIERQIRQRVPVASPAPGGARTTDPAAPVGALAPVPARGPAREPAHGRGPAAGHAPSGQRGPGDWRPPHGPARGHRGHERHPAERRPEGGRPHGRTSHGRAQGGPPSAGSGPDRAGGHARPHGSAHPGPHAPGSRPSGHARRRFRSGSGPRRPR